MKTTLQFILLLTCTGVLGQDLDGLIGQNRTAMRAEANNTNGYGSDSGLEEDAFIAAARANDIPQRIFRDELDVLNGYYAIAGVFSDAKKLDKQVKKFTKQGFKAGFFLNPANKLNYLFLNRYDDWKSAIDAISSKFNGNYTDQVWALMVANPNARQPQIPLEEIAYEDLADSAISQTGAVVKETVTKSNPRPKRITAEQPSLDAEDTDAPLVSLTRNNIKESNGPKSTLVKRADDYFDKMWYAEAAKLYEQALEKNDGDYSFEVLQRVGDSHYFNTNMEQAYKWYSILHEKYGDAFSADNIFKYAHSLKGNGNYARSKRLMRLYNKKVVEEGIAQKERLSEKQEMVLDELMNSLPNFEVKDAGINTQYSEFSPMYLEDQVVFASAKDSSVFSTRRYKWDDQPYLDLYTAQLNQETQELKDALKFSKEINTKYHEASVAFTPDGETMYFTRNNYGKKLRRDKNGINHLKIYVSKKVDGAWTEATEVPFNSDDYSTGHPALSKDGKKMYFVSDMPGSIGETDIFVVDILGDGNFSTPKNLGPEVNTEQKEMFPFIKEDKLYFSSNGHTGLGGLDVYQATMGEEGGFSLVKNMGKPINSNMDDFSYIIDDTKEKGFFASNREGGKGRDDIYSFAKIRPEEVPTNVNAIAGVVVDLITGDVMPKALVELLDENNIKLKEMETLADGSFIFEDLEANTKYTLRTTADTYFENTMQVSTLENDTVNVDVAMRKLQEMIAVENGIRKLKTEMIHFDFDKSYIRPDAAVELKKLVEVMNEYPDMVIKIESHTDSRGSDVYNEYLSDKRAKSTRDYIISQGIAPERIESAIGYGEYRLLNECDGSVSCTEEKHYLNRRSEFIIVKM